MLPRATGGDSPGVTPVQGAAFAEFVIDHIVAQSRGWQPHASIAELQRALSTLPASHAANVFRKRAGNLNALFREHGRVWSPLLVIDGTVVRLREPPPEPDAAERLVSYEHLERVASCFARIAREKAQAQRIVERARIDADRRRARGLVWSPTSHRSFGPRFQLVVVTLFTLHLSDPKTGRPRFPAARFCDLHVDLLVRIIGFL